MTRTRPRHPDRYDGSVTTNSSANDWVSSINLNVARHNEPIATDTVQSYPLPDNARYHAWISQSERELLRSHGRDNIDKYNGVGSDNENGEDDDSEYNVVGSGDDEGEDDDSITLIGNESGNLDTINTSSAETRHTTTGSNPGTQIGTRIESTCSKFATSSLASWSQLMY